VSRNLAVGGVVVAVLLVGGWVLAQHEDDPCLSVPVQESDTPGPFAKLPVPDIDKMKVQRLEMYPGPYTVIAGAQATVLLDAKSGMTWVLHQSAAGIPMWLAVTRVDDSNAVGVYLRANEEESRRKLREDEMNGRVLRPDLRMYRDEPGPDNTK
jgi:hypothetical protein